MTYYEASAMTLNTSLDGVKGHLPSTITLAENLLLASLARTTCNASNSLPPSVISGLVWPRGPLETLRHQFTIHKGLRVYSKPEAPVSPALERTVELISGDLDETCATFIGLRWFAEDCTLSVGLAIAEYELNRIDEEDKFYMTSFDLVGPLGLLQQVGHTIGDYIARIPTAQDQKQLDGLLRVLRMAPFASWFLDSAIIDEGQSSWTWGNQSLVGDGLSLGSPLQPGDLPACLGLAMSIDNRTAFWDIQPCGQVKYQCLEYTRLHISSGGYGWYCISPCIK